MAALLTQRVSFHLPGTLAASFETQTESVRALHGQHFAWKFTHLQNYSFCDYTCGPAVGYPWKLTQQCTNKKFPCHCLSVASLETSQSVAAIWVIKHVCPVQLWQLTGSCARNRALWWGKTQGVVSISLLFIAALWVSPFGRPQTLSLQNCPHWWIRSPQYAWGDWTLSWKLSHYCNLEK